MTPNGKLSKRSAAFREECPENKFASYSPFIKTKVNVDDLETREVFYTRPQDGFSLKSKSK